ncbi:MAG: acyltransferase [Muribaculaceae bacterium]|nr:acyltransferase [Muribaculaceae bacterium]
MTSENIFDFSDISPIEDADFHNCMVRMVAEPGFKHAVEFSIPGVNYDEFSQMLLTIPDKKTFQEGVMRNFMLGLMKKTMSGLTASGVDTLAENGDFTFISNHRDIVLDASLLNMCLFDANRRTAEVAIGSNLLIYDWIDTIVRMNKCFIVKRGMKPLEALNAAKQLSAYIYYAINEKHESVWIAQREGRAKDSSDHTQESLIKMLSLEGGQSARDNLALKNIAPVSIAYEYDPCDYLKAREFMLKRRDPEYKKTQRDDLFSMETGLLQFKGKVHFSFTPCLTEQIKALPDNLDRNSVIRSVCALIDKAIHLNYKIFNVNYIAYDLLYKTGEFASKYTDAERDAFIAYVNKQLDKVDVPDVSAEEREYMFEMVLTMYSNPLKNKMLASQE